MDPEIPAAEKTWKVGTLTYSLGGLIRLSCWLLWGDFAWSVRDRAIPSVIQLLFSKFGASNFVVGLLFSSLPAALGLVIGPIVGYKSDRLRTRWGRRIPFLIVTTPFIVISVAGLAFCVQLGAVLDHFLGVHSPGTKASALIVLGILWTLFELALTTAYGVFGALVNDVVPQKVLGRFFGMFRAVSLIAGIIFFFWLMGSAETYFMWIFLGVAAVYGFGFTLMCFNVKEGQYPPPPHVDGKPGSAWTSIKTYFKDGFGHTYYLWYFASTILGGLAAGPFNLYSLFYARSLAVNMTDYGHCLALTYFCSLVLSYPLGMLADRFHPLRLTIVVLSAYALVMLYGFYFVHDARLFDIVLVVHGVVSGTLFTSWASLSQRLLPRSKFAEIGSAGGIIGSLIGIVIAPSMGLFLDLHHKEYRYTFFLGFFITVAAVASFLVLHAKFMKLGGPKHYVAPE
jgi:MFS family permease